MALRRTVSNIERNEPLDQENDQPRNIEQSKWRFPRLVISVIKALNSSLPIVDDTNKTETEALLPVPADSSHTAIDIQTENRSSQPLDKAILDQLVEEKNSDQLQMLGGVEGIASALGSSLQEGLITKQHVARNRDQFGSNELNNPWKRSFIRTLRGSIIDQTIDVDLSFYFGFPIGGQEAGIVWQALFSFSVVIMAVCGALTLYFGIIVDDDEGIKTGVSIFVAIFLAVVVDCVSEYYYYKVLEVLHSARENVLFDVMRGGRIQKVAMLEIVVGDVVFLKPGDLVPGHGLLIEKNYQKVKLLDRESCAESEGVELETISQLPFLSSGTKVVDSFAPMLITSVGMHKSKVSCNFRDKIVLENLLGTLDKIIDLVGYTLAFIFFVLTLAGSNSFEDENGEILEGNEEANAVVKILVGIIVTVVNVPDPLALVLTLTWACATKKLIAQNALVLKPSDLEALSYANTVCIDMTNEMKVVDFWQPSGERFQQGRVYKLLEEGIALNCRSRGLTEEAILTWATKDLKIDIEKVNMNSEVNPTFHSDVDDENFLILAKRKDDDSKIQAHWSGAAEMILHRCSSFYDAFGTLQQINETQKSDFKKIIQAMEEKGLKCIAFAHKEITTQELEHKEMLTLLGVVGIFNIPRRGLENTVEKFREAGVKVKLITKDNISVAKAMAVKYGILSLSHDAATIIQSLEFRNLLLNERRDRLDSICVMASSAPCDKIMMLKCLKRKGEVVALISDATNNEYLVMKEADAVISMGIDADETAGIVILNGNFSSLPYLLSWGRCIYANIQKFIQYQLTASFAALVVNVIGGFIGGGIPLTTLQLLWFDIVTNTLGAFGFSREKPEEELLKKPPLQKTDPIITNIMLRNILTQSIYQIAILLVGLAFDSIHDKVKLTLLFNSFLLCQVFNMFNSKSLEKKNVFRGILRNKLFLSIVTVTIILQVIFVEILKTLIDSERLDWFQWGLCAAIASVTLPIGWVSKLLPVPKKQVFKYVMVIAQIEERIQGFVLTKLRSFSIWSSLVLTRVNQQQGRFLSMTHHAEVDE